MRNLFTELQAAVAGRLRSDEWMASPPAVKVSAESEGDVASAIDRGLKGAGAAVVVMTPRVARGDRGDASELEVTILVGIAEAPTINRGPTGTQKTAGDIATSVLAQLWDFSPSGEWQPLSFVERVLEESTPDLVAYALRFETSIRVTPQDAPETGTAAVAR